MIAIEGTQIEIQTLRSLWIWEYYLWDPGGEKRGLVVVVVVVVIVVVCGGSEDDMAGFLLVCSSSSSSSSSSIISHLREGMAEGGSRVVLRASSVIHALQRL